MEAYSIFAKVYDEFMEDIPYGEWAGWMDDFLQEKGMAGSRILELGCGTGNLTFLLAELGYLVTGTDLSMEMLKKAEKKAKKEKLSLKFQQQDMRMLDLEEKFPVIISVCDSVNYLLTVEELEMMLDGVGKHLEKNGFFIFDVKTKEFYENMGEQVFTDECSKGYYVWENYFDSENNDNQYYLTFFLKKLGNHYKKYEEEHIQHAFWPEEIEKAVHGAGLKIYDNKFQKADSMQDGNERICYILQKMED